MTDRTSAQSIFGRILAAIEVDERHDEACCQHRRERGRCRKGCPVPQMVGREILDTLPPVESAAPSPGCSHCPGNGIAVCIDRSCITREFLAGAPLASFRTYATACICAEGGRRQAQHLPGQPDMSFWRTFSLTSDIWIHNQSEHQIRVQAKALIEHIRDHGFESTEWKP